MKALVIGYGSIGKRHIENLSTFSNIEIIICTKRENDHFTKQKNCKFIKSLSLCIKEKPDFAIIANITKKHISTAMKLAENNIPFLCEKPLSNNYNSVSKLLNIVKKKKIITLMGCHLRFHPCLKNIKHYLENGSIGKIISIQVENGSYLPDWHPEEDYRKSYSASKSSGGIILTCIHELDYLYWLLGNIDEVFSFTSKLSSLKISSSDHSSIILKFSSGVMGEIHLDYYQKPSRRKCTIFGTTGNLHCDLIKNTISIFKHNSKQPNKKSIKKFNLNQMYLDELKHFINCIQGKEKSINSIQEGSKLLKIGLSMIDSSTKKRMVLIK